MTVAWTALILWPVVCIILYQRTSLPIAFCASMIGGFLLLPNGVSYDLPLLPPLNRTSIPTFTVLLLTAIMIGKARQTLFVLDGWLPRNPVIIGLVVLLVVGSFGTVLTNRDPLYYGFRTLPPMQLYDGFSLLLSLFVLILPFFIARRVLATSEGHRVLILAFVISALIYTLPALYEVRMSPQLHRMVYGFFPHSWLQALRGGGFRPNVFLEHGLVLGIFLACAVIGTAGLFRAAPAPDRSKWLFATFWLLGVLVLAKSLGALLIALVIVPVIFFCSHRLQLLFAACLVGVVLTYPVLRAVDVVPTQRILAFAQSINPQRAASLEFRFRNEDMLLEKASERPLFGWGLWSRNRVYDARGRDIAVTDGWWIGTFGTGGWAQYISFFGLLCWPVIGLFLKRRAEVDPATVTIALMLVANLIDLLPNAAVTPLTWMMAGALAGRLELRQGAAEPTAKPAREPRQAGPVYARSFPGKRKNTPPSAKNLDVKGASYKRRKPAPGYRR